MASEALGFLTSIYSWVDTNFGSIITSALSLLLLFAVYRVIAIELNRLRNQGLLEVNSAHLIRNMVRWTLTIVSGVVVFNLLGVKLDFFVGLWVLAGGTIIGFASMNTIGNAIAGIIIMVSRPFKVKDRLVFREQFVEVEEIDLIYTRMRTLDNVVISVPNQMVLETVVENQSFYDYVRRRCAVTMDYSEDPKRVKNILLKAAGVVEGLAANREPYVWVTDLGNYAIEYTLFYFIDDVKRILELDSKIRDAVFEAFTAEGIELSTPTLIRTLK
ncbi:mechanosensitive ion channel family protein [Candidatus Bathyarchaeota archaeon]|nr:mechanosensitive ion channel family protein [Candidatus Bathyarchaeota archaeon]